MCRLRTFLLLLAGVYLVGCQQSPRQPVSAGVTAITDPAGKVSPSSMYDVIPFTYRHAEILPDTVLKNNRPTDTFQVYGHTVILMYQEDNPLRIIIDGKRVSLRARQTLNEVEEDLRPEANYTADWQSVKVFRHHGRMLIGITLGVQMCTGLSCSVFHFLLYDVRAQKYTVFGAFRGMANLRLYDIQQNGEVNYVASTFYGDPALNVTKLIWELYTLRPGGTFSVSKSSQGIPHRLTTVGTSDAVGYQIEDSQWFETVTTP